MNYDAHPNLVLPRGYNRVSMLEGIGKIMTGKQFLIDGWLFETNALHLEEVDSIMQIHHLPAFPQNMATIIPDEVRPDSTFWRSFQERGIAIFPQATPEKSGGSPERVYNYMHLRRTLFLQAAQALQNGQI